MHEIYLGVKMNNTIIPAKTICSHCQNIGLIDADYCVSCGVSFVFGKPDAWSTKPYTDLSKEIEREFYNKETEEIFEQMRHDVYSLIFGLKI